VSYVVRLDRFEGPLDLLLYLIQREEMDIWNIPIARITEQYLRSIDALETLDLQTAGEFLVMAATLLRIKARMLLPVERAGEDAEEDPRRELVERLLEYKKFKEAAERLEARAADRARWFTRPLDPALVDAMKAYGDEVTFEVNMAELLKALTAVLSRFDEVVTHDVQLEPVSLEDALGRVRERLGERGRLAWSELFAGVRSRLDVIVTFMAMLELAKLGEIRLQQGADFGEIWIWSRAGEPAPAPAEEGEGS
jgi:segregation and condensation protein A